MEIAIVEVTVYWAKANELPDYIYDLGREYNTDEEDIVIQFQSNGNNRWCPNYYSNVFDFMIGESILDEEDIQYLISIAKNKESVIPSIFEECKLQTFITIWYYDSWQTWEGDWDDRFWCDGKLDMNSIKTILGGVNES